MNKVSLMACVGVFSTVGTGQEVFSPHMGFGTERGQAWASALGDHPDGRYQFADGNLRNRSLLLKRVSYRYDSKQYDPQTGMGRSFVNVSLHLSECDLVKVTPNLSANATSTPSLVFTGSVTWPTLQGPQNTTAWSMQFPCRPFVWTGTADLLADYRFTGGTLANNKVWSGFYAPYHLDSYKVRHTTSSFGEHLRSPTGVCRDSALPGKPDPYSYLWMRAFSTTHPVLSYRHKMYLAMYSGYTAPDAAVIHLVDVAGVTSGWPFPGITCSKVYVAGTPAMVLTALHHQGGPYSPVNHLGLPNGLLPYDASAVGNKLYGQAAWLDSRTGALKFTTGTSVVVPGRPLVSSDLAARRVCILQPYPGATAYKHVTGFRNQITRYH